MGSSSIKASDVARRAEAATIPGSGMYFSSLGIEKLLPDVCSFHNTLGYTCSMVRGEMADRAEIPELGSCSFV